MRNNKLWIIRFYHYLIYLQKKTGYNEIQKLKHKMQSQTGKMSPLFQVLRQEKQWKKPKKKLCWFMGWCRELPRLGLKSKNGSLISCLDSFYSGALCCSRLKLEFFVFLGTSTRVLWLGLPFLLLCSEESKSREEDVHNQMRGRNTLDFPEGDVRTFCFAACSATMSLKSSFSTWACCSLTCSSYFCVMAMGSSSSSSGARATSTPCNSWPPPVFRLAMACRRRGEYVNQEPGKQQVKQANLCFSLCANRPRASYRRHVVNVCRSHHGRPYWAGSSLWQYCEQLRGLVSVKTKRHSFRKWIKKQQLQGMI